MTTEDDAVRSGRCDPMHPTSIAAAWLAQLTDRCRELRHCARTLLLVPPPCLDCYAPSPDAKVGQGTSEHLTSPGPEQSSAAAFGSPASALTEQVQRPRPTVTVEPGAGFQRCSASRVTKTALGTACASCKASTKNTFEGPERAAVRFALAPPPPLIEPRSASRGTDKSPDVRVGTVYRPASPVREMGGSISE
ncbi:hypothetical protein MRX96_021146 [Rhipicephalus microplus]